LSRSLYVAETGLKYNRMTGQTTGQSGTLFCDGIINWTTGRLQGPG